MLPDEFVPSWCRVPAKLGSAGEGGGGHNLHNQSRYLANDNSEPIYI